MRFRAFAAAALATFLAALPAASQNAPAPAAQPAPAPAAAPATVYNIEVVIFRANQALGGP